MMTDQEPQPYDSESNTFASFSDIQTTPIHNIPGMISTKLQFLPNVPDLPHIPDSFLLLSPENASAWKSVIPKHIHIKDSIHLILDNKQTIHNFNHTKQSIQSILSSITSLTIQIPYYISIPTLDSIPDCITLNQSMGESDIFTNYLLGIPNRQQANPIQRNLPTGTGTLQSMVQTLLNISLDNIQQDYTAQLQTLRTMGFMDESVNYNALVRTFGNVDAAISILVEPP